MRKDVASNLWLIRSINKAGQFKGMGRRWIEIFNLLKVTRFIYLPFKMGEN